MPEIDRRTMIAVSAAFLWGCVARGEAGALTEPQQRLLSQVADLVIPRTATPGAIDAKVPEFVALALEHGLAEPETDYGAWLEKTVGTDTPRALAKLDAEAFAKDAPPSPWKTLKGLILTGYFTSEAGATQALRYELVPGRWEPGIPLKPGDRSWASDWTAVDFG
jgi:Gluconate 2-dehydrogenase subunit 3